MCRTATATPYRYRPTTDDLLAIICALAGSPHRTDTTPADHAEVQDGEDAPLVPPPT